MDRNYYDIEAAFAEIENELITSMIRNMRHHKLEEQAEGKEWAQWQAVALAELGEYKKRNRKKFTRNFEAINMALEDAINQARADGAMQQEAEILEAIKNGYGYYSTGKAIHGSFFRINDKKMSALIEASVNDMKKAETAMLRKANDEYRKIIYTTQVHMASGAVTYEKAVDLAAKNFVAEGINCIKYKNGAMHNIKDYADMVLKTTVKRAYLTGEGEMRQKYGMPALVIMNKRSCPCPKCLPFVGKVLIDDVWSGGKPDGKHKLMSQAIADGLYHPRCKDSHTTYFGDVRGEKEVERENTFSPKEIEQVRDDYKKEQEKQKKQREIARLVRQEKFSVDLNNKAVAKRKKETLQANLNKMVAIDNFSAKIGLNKSERMAINNYISSDSYKINDKLRREIEWAKLSRLDREMINNLDSALKKVPRYEGTLIRVLRFGDEKLTNDFVKTYQVGKTVQFKEYISTSKLNKGYNPDGEVEMYIQKTQNGRDISMFNQEEGEVLYERNSKFRVLNLKEKKGKYYILLEEI